MKHYVLYTLFKLYLTDEYFSAKNSDLRKADFRPNKMQYMRTASWRHAGKCMCCAWRQSQSVTVFCCCCLRVLMNEDAIDDGNDGTRSWWTGSGSFVKYICTRNVETGAKPLRSPVLCTKNCRLKVDGSLPRQKLIKKFFACVYFMDLPHKIRGS